MIDTPNIMPVSTMIAGEQCGVEEEGCIQLSRLSSVLNGLEGGAQMMHRHLLQTSDAIKAGSYRVDPLKVSHRIIGEALRTL
jgi:hypothetical protein